MIRQINTLFNEDILDVLEGVLYMQRSTLMFSLLGAWALAIVYDRIEINTGLEIKVILGMAMLTMIVSLYLFYRNSKDVEERDVR